VKARKMEQRTGKKEINPQTSSETRSVCEAKEGGVKGK